MADKSTTDQKLSSGRSELEKGVKQQIMLSMGLHFEEKDTLISKLPTLSEKQLQQLKEVFDKENERKEKILGDFFAENPQLYPEFERFSKEHVSSIYRGVEDGEKPSEEQRMQELLQTNY